MEIEEVEAHAGVSQPGERLRMCAGGSVLPMGTCYRGLGTPSAVAACFYISPVMPHAPQVLGALVVILPRSAPLIVSQDPLAAT